MKYLFLLLFTVTLFAACNNNTPKSEALAASSSFSDSLTSITREITVIEPFVSEEGGFKVLFPDTPSRQEQTIPSEVGQIKLVQYMYEKDKTQAWLVSYSDYPKQMMDLGSDKQLLKGIRYQVLQGLGARAKNEQEITLHDKFNGIAFNAYSKRRKMDVIYRIYLVNNRVFQLGMFSSIGPFPTQDSSDFMGSFELLKDYHENLVNATSENVPS